MIIRLTAYVAALLLLPPLALSLAGLDWVAPAPIAGAAWLPALFGTLALLAFGLLLDTLNLRRSGHSLLREQRGFLLWSGVAGAIICLLLAYLNLFASAWFIPVSPVASLLLAALCGAALLPTVLLTRLWLAGLLHLNTRRFALPALPAETAAYMLLLAALGGLFCGTVWPEYLGWLFWLAPLLLLVALQLLWLESTVFTGLPQGDWSRILLGALSGIVVGGLALAVYDASGGALLFSATVWQLSAYLAVFGLLCLQLGDVVAEHWRGKPRGQVFKKKPFPIPVVTKRDL
ncbi:MAG: hypothetical protein PHQ60_11625 [Sideroxydans sp.]|nr:hypothetical protein [Sideroxydans sp.]